MDAQLAGFLADAVGLANDLELSVRDADDESTHARTLDRLALLQEAAAGLALGRTAGIANAASVLLARGRTARPLLLRALARLRQVLTTAAITGIEPPGDDHDLMAAEKPLPLSDILARARDRLLEISPA